MPASVVIVLLVLVAVACYRATRRGAGGRFQTALVALACGTVALASLVGAALLVPCAYQQLFPDPLPRAMTSEPSFCPSFLNSGER